MEDWFYTELLSKLNQWNPIVLSIILWLSLYVALFLFLFIISYIREHKKRKLKYNWIWDFKMTKVSVVWKEYIRERNSAWDYSSWHYVYRLESEDETGNVYKSREFSEKEVEYGWRTLEEMVKKCGWETYDLWNKEAAIKNLNKNIERLGAELQDNPGFFRKCWLEWDIFTLKKYINIAKEWPIATYLVINGHKISVWDRIDVYVNPEDSKEYYFDLDFTEVN